MEDKIRDEKLQYDINRETTKILVLPSGKIDKQEYIWEILTSDQSGILEQATFWYKHFDTMIEASIDCTSKIDNAQINYAKD